jgi:polysaccharide biosynthesis/export protein
MRWKRLFRKWVFGHHSPRTLEKEPMKMKSLIHRVALLPVVLSMMAAVFLVVLSGCETNSHSVQYSSKDVALPVQNTNDVVLKPGDVVKVIFPNGEKMDTVETIRPDGKITLTIIGDVAVAGKTPEQFRKELVERYSKEIVSSQNILVVVESYSFPIYVMGAVMRPGKITADHTLTVLEALMEAGGFDPERAQLKAVKVVRTQGGRTQTFKVNLKGIQTPGAPVEIFYLQPNDIVMVPQKLVIF